MQQDTPCESIEWLLRTMNRMVLCRDTDALLDVAYQAIREELGYDRVGLLLADPTGTMLVEHVGTDESGRQTWPDRTTALSREKAIFRARVLADARLRADGPGYIFGRDMYRVVPPSQRHLLDGQAPQNILVGLRTAHKALGLISVDNLVTRRPIEEHAAVELVAFANTLATAIENVTLLEERERHIDTLDAALQRRVDELEWLRDVSQKVNAARSLDETLDVVYDAIQTGLGYDRVGIQLFDYQAGWWQDLRGTDAQGRKTCPADRIVLRKNDVRWRSPDMVALVAGADYYYSADVYAETPPELRPMLDGAPTQNLNVPLRSGAGLIGIISVDNLLSRRPISLDDAGPLMALGNHVGTAVENARLQDQERAERARLEVLLDGARALNSTLDADRILQQLAAQLLAALGAVSVSFCSVDMSTRRCMTVARHIAPTHVTPIPPPDARSQLDDYPAMECVLTTRQPFQAGVDDPECPPSESAFLRRHSVKAELLVPVVIQGEPAGVLEVQWSHAARVGAETRALCTALAEQAALALHNARLYAEVAARADRDPLTGLLHHRAFVERLDTALATTTTPLALLVLDVDNFKLFNDTYGHLTGDAVLQSVAAILSNLCRDDDAAARYGGDEFAVLLSNVAPSEVGPIVARLAEAVRACPCRTASGDVIPLSVSVGVALYPAQGTDRPALLAAADADMYAAKRGERRDVAGGHPVAAVIPAERSYRRAADLLGETPMSVLDGLVDAVDAKDRYTRMHADDTTHLALSLADALGLGAEERRVLALAGLLHDVGKIVVPDRVLRKPGPLAPEEAALLRRHVDYSIAIVRGVLPDEAVLSAIAAHHERWDGGGYPAATPGPETPLPGRILQLAVAVAAMRLDRPYRQALAWPEIVRELRAGAGSQFDPALVEPFIASLDAHTLDVAS